MARYKLKDIEGSIVMKDRELPSQQESFMYTSRKGKEKHKVRLHKSRKDNRHLEKLKKHSIFMVTWLQHCKT